MNSENPILMAREYLTEIERRLAELGWTKQDIQFPAWSPQRAEWLMLVNPAAPKEMTDEAWNELKPELIPLLEANRDSRLRMERENRRIDRYDRLSQLFSDMKHQTPLVSFEIGEYGNPNSSKSRTVSQELAFPGTSDVLQWSVIESLLEADTSADELEQAFGLRREEVDTLVLQWRNRLHGRLVTTIPKPEGEILRPTLTINKSNPFKDLPDELKLLLRADSLFLIAGSPTKPLTYKDIIRLTEPDSHPTSPATSKSEQPLNIDSISEFPWARGVAQVLLKSMGCPDASYLELEGEWVCGRCQDSEPRTWTQMVEHYVQEELLHFTVRADMKKMNIPHNDLHDPALFTDRPLIKYVPTGILGADLAQLRGQIRQCRICARSLIRRDVRGREGQILKHLLDVHGIQKPKRREHYGTPVELATLNSSVSQSTGDLSDDGQAIPDDGGEMYDYAEYEGFEEEMGGSEGDSEMEAWMGFEYDLDEWGG